MDIDRYMVDLFFEIKRSLPASQQSSMRIADSDLGAQMVDLYKSTDNGIIKVLIESFLEHAGGEWSKEIGAEQTMDDREQLMADERAEKKVRYYRGVRIED